MKKKILSLILAFVSVFGIAVNSGVVVAQAATVEQSKSAVVTYNENYDRLDVDKDFINQTGMTKQEKKMLQNEFNALPQSKKNELLKNADTRVAPLIVWAAKILASAGLSWMAKKLYDWGASKFCKAYRNSNWATKKVCSVIG